MNKSLLTNLIAIVLIVVGFLLPDPWARPVLYCGLFAFAGAITNALAIHMLFEKIPGFYGSGVIVAQFDTFRRSIEQLIMEQFFSKVHLEQFISEQTPRQFDFTETLETVDLSPAWHALLTAIKASSLGGMLAAVAREKQLQRLQTSFENKLRSALIETAASATFQEHIHGKLTGMTVTDQLHQQVQHIVQARLDELSPEMVKDIIHAMIQKHLGWLVIWGGVAGGFIGLVTSFLPTR